MGSNRPLCSQCHRDKKACIASIRPSGNAGAGVGVGIDPNPCQRCVKRRLACAPAVPWTDSSRNRWAIPSTHFYVKHFNRFLNSTSNENDLGNVDGQYMKQKRVLEDGTEGLGSVYDEDLPVPPGPVTYYSIDEELDNADPENENAVITVPHDVVQLSRAGGHSDVPSYSHLENMTDGILKCRRVCCVDIRYMIRWLPPGRYRTTWHFRFSEPTGVSEKNPLFYPVYISPPNGGRHIDRPARPTFCVIRQGIAGRNQWDAQWNPNANDSVADSAALPSRYFTSTQPSSTLALTDSVLQSRMDAGWVTLVPSGINNVQAGADQILTEASCQAESNLQVLEQDRHVLLSFSGFCGNWTGRFRFAGVVLERLQAGEYVSSNSRPKKRQKR